MGAINNLQTWLLVVSSSLAVIAVMTVGIIITVKMTGKNKEGFREALASLGGVLLGIIVTTGAVGLVGLATWASQQVFG